MTTAIQPREGAPRPVQRWNPLRELADLHERTSLIARPARVACIALNTRRLDEDAARRAIEAAEDEAGLPAGDPVRFGAERLTAALLAD